MSRQIHSLLRLPAGAILAPTESPGLRGAPNRDSQFQHPVANTTAAAGVTQPLSYFQVGKTFSVVERLNLLTAWGWRTTHRIWSIPPIDRLLQALRFVVTLESDQFVESDDVVCSMNRQNVYILPGRCSRGVVNRERNLQFPQTPGSVGDNRPISIAHLEVSLIRGSVASFGVAYCTVPIKESRQPSPHKVNVLGHVLSLTPRRLICQGVN